MRARLSKILDTTTTIISYAPIVLYVYVYVLKDSIKCYSNCAQND